MGKGKVAPRGLAGAGGEPVEVVPVAHPGILQGDIALAGGIFSGGVDAVGQFAVELSGEHGGNFGGQEGQDIERGDLRGGVDAFVGLLAEARFEFEVALRGSRFAEVKVADIDHFMRDINLHPVDGEVGISGQDQMTAAAEVFEISPDHHGTEVHAGPADRGLAEGQFNGHVGALDPSAVELRRQEEGIPRLGRDDGVLLFQFVVRRDNAEVGPGDVDAVDLPAAAEDARGIKPTGGATSVEAADGLSGPAGAGKTGCGDGKVGVEGERAEFSLDL